MRLLPKEQTPSYPFGSSAALGSFVAICEPGVAEENEDPWLCCTWFIACTQKAKTGRVGIPNQPVSPFAPLEAWPSRTTARLGVHSLLRSVEHAGRYSAPLVALTRPSSSTLVCARKIVGGRLYDTINAR